MVAPPDNDVLWARALHFQHSDGSPALLGVSLGVQEGEILAVSGPRGSGKTTLLRCLSGLVPAQRGEVWFNSVPVHTMGPLTRERLRRDRFGWIDPAPVLVPELNVWENAALPLMLRGTGRRLAKTTALEWLERLDIGDRARNRPHELTQAERQRVAIARALAPAPTVLFADEPTAPLHRADRAHVLRTLTTAARSHGITVVLATHDPETAALADRTVSLLDGRRVNTLHLPAFPEARSTDQERPAQARKAEPGSRRSGPHSRGTEREGPTSRARGRETGPAGRATDEREGLTNRAQGRETGPAGRATDEREGLTNRAQGRETGPAGRDTERESRASLTQGRETGTAGRTTERESRANLAQGKAMGPAGRETEREGLTSRAQGQGADSAGRGVEADGGAGRPEGEGPEPEGHAAKPEGRGAETEGQGAACSLSV